MSFDDRRSGQKLFDERDVILVGSLGQQKRRSRARWGSLLVVFMRLVAAIWLVLGLGAWFHILAPSQPPFESLPTDAAGAIIFFAIAHPLAATGMWMATPWGGVLWLVTLAAQIAAIVAFPTYFPGGQLLLVSLTGLGIGYFLLTYYAAHERID
ncbi:MAG: DUF6163 family protein [Beijerinckiaceae bacterium]